MTLVSKFDGNCAAEAWFTLTKFKHEVDLNGARSASIRHAPLLLTAQYHSLPNSTVQPFIGANYGWVAVSGERTTGPIAGTIVDFKNAEGFVGQLRLDCCATPNIIRADARYFDRKSKVELNGARIGQASIAPWIYRARVGYRF